MRSNAGPLQQVNGSADFFIGAFREGLLIAYGLIPAHARLETIVTRGFRVNGKMMRPNHEYRCWHLAARDGRYKSFAKHA